MYLIQNIINNHNNKAQAKKGNYNLRKNLKLIINANNLTKPLINKDNYNQRKNLKLNININNLTKPLITNRNNSIMVSKRTIMMLMI